MHSDTPALADRLAQATQSLADALQTWTASLPRCTPRSIASLPRWTTASLQASELRQPHAGPAQPKLAELEKTNRI